MPARKRVAATVRIQLQAGEASPGKVGQSLGAYGVNIVAFMTAYNRASAAQRGMVVPAVVTVYDDRSFDLQLRTPPTSALLAGRPASPGAAAAPAPTPPSPSSIATSSARSPGPSSPTSTPTTWTPPSASSPAPPAPWASRWSTPGDGRAAAAPGS